jgi:hypothetical protein
LLRSPDEGRALGRQAALRVHADYSWTDLAARLARLLEEVVETGPPA